jgi:hypothetical protein
MVVAYVSVIYILGLTHIRFVTLNHQDCQGSSPGCVCYSCKTMRLWDRFLRVLRAPCGNGGYTGHVVPSGTIPVFLHNYSPLSIIFTIISYCSLLAGAPESYWTALMNENFIHP